MSHMFEIAHHVDADVETVHRLVRKYGNELLVAIKCQQENGRPEYACLTAEGYLLWISSHSYVEEQVRSLELKDKTEFHILGMPIDCDLAQAVMKNFENEPGAEVCYPNSKS